jgi:DNA-3-methyladenine glycosylase I
MKDSAKMQRCAWATSELGMIYHDRQWGVPVHDDRMLFEMLILEGAQAGLSWETILKKRENYRAAFDHFDAEKIARYGSRKLAQFLANPGIVRNRLKIGAAVQNAQAVLRVREEFGSFDRYLLAVCRWTAAAKRLAEHEADPGSHSAIGCPQQRSPRPRLQVRRHYDLLRVHASSRNGERSPGRMLSLSGAERGVYQGRLTEEFVGVQALVCGRQPKG